MTSPPHDRTTVIEPLLLTAVRVCTFDLSRPLTNASGFFFEAGGQLFLITTRHVLIDEPSLHFPSRIEIELHIDAADLGRSIGFSIPLYQGGRAVWRQARDGSGEVDVAAIRLDRAALPDSLVYRAFTPERMHSPPAPIEIGSPLLVVGFPMGFHDRLHHLPVARHAVIASSYGLRFEGQGYFLTDARTHRGTSGAPVVMRASRDTAVGGDLPWWLLGVHSARLEASSRDVDQDEVLGLNCAWYADVLSTLTHDT